MKRIKILLFFILILAFFINAEASTGVGRIIQLIGDVDLTDVNTGIRIVPDVGTQVQENHKIRTGSKSYIEILLNDNTKIFMRELSVMQISSLRNRAQDPPAEIKFYTGKIRININKVLSGRNLILKTNVAIIGVRDVQTDFAVITTDYETKLAIIEGQADIASSNREIIKSYELKKKEETSIMLNMAPSEPIVLPREILDSWLDYYYVVDKKRIMVRGRQDSGVIDYILRKRKF